MNGQMLQIMGMLLTISFIGIAFICKYLWNTLAVEKKVLSIALLIAYVGTINTIGMIFFPEFIAP